MTSRHSSHKEEREPLSTREMFYLSSTLDFDLPPLFLRFTVRGSSDQGHFEPIIIEDLAITSQTSHGECSGQSICSRYLCMFVCLHIYIYMFMYEYKYM